MHSTLHRVLLLTACLLSPSVHAEGQSQLLNMGFEQLLEVEVSTAARKEQSLSRTAAAVTVITRDEIRRSGARSLPEALRLAPGVAVAQIGPAKWSISIRGFSGRLANKLLVLIDGRSLYTPIHSGVYWELHDLLLDDVERIEVVRGPGATLWGSNAVNGIINVITRHSAHTQGGLVELDAGSENREASARWGGAAGSDSHFRVYGKAREGDGFESRDGHSRMDEDFDGERAGFRADWISGATDQFNLQGDLGRLRQDQVYDTVESDLPPTYRRRFHDQVKAQTANLLGKWQHSLAADSDLRLQFYADYYSHESDLWQEDVTTIDVDFQHHSAWASRHDVVWGLGYRYVDYEFTGNPRYISTDPQEDGMSTFSAFVQDEINLLRDSLWLTLGTKVEHNELTGTEWQPNARLLWTPNERHSVWASVARAVRTPSIGERDANTNLYVLPPGSPRNPAPLPIVAVIAGNPEYGSESLLAYELGYRVSVNPALTLDSALFYNDYDNLLATRIGSPGYGPGYIQAPLNPVNGMEGRNYGLELSADWRPTETWRIQPTVSLLYSDYRITSNDGSIEPGGPAHREGTDPQWQVGLRAGWSPRHDLDLDMWWRSVGRLKNIQTWAPGAGITEIDAYSTLDVRLAWRPSKDLELALIGKNLLAPSHLEAVEELWTIPVEVPRSAMATFRYRF